MYNVLKKALRKVKTIFFGENKFYEIPKIHGAFEAFGNPAYRLSHISAFSYANAGDVMLPLAVRDSFHVILEQPIDWQGIRLYAEVDHREIALLNNSDAVVIGGGGLFLKDTNRNNKSGWQWACSLDDLDKIKVPLILFAVGYNRFRDQDDFDPIFTKHVNKFIAKSIFFGLRNHGSIENMKRYIEPQYHDKICFQPCPTTILYPLYKDLIDDVKSKMDERPFIAFNCAFDRADLRFGQDSDEKLKAVARVAKRLSTDYHIKYYVHCKPDENFLPYLTEAEVNVEVVNLQGSPELIVTEYSKPSLTIGMRGHAQMIPFGCQTPILSIISHNKVRWFLEDIDHLDWGSEITSDAFEQDLEDKARYILENKSKIQEEIVEAQAKLLDITIQNLNYISKKLKK